MSDDEKAQRWREYFARNGATTDAELDAAVEAAQVALRFGGDKHVAAKVGREAAERIRRSATSYPSHDGSRTSSDQKPPRMTSMDLPTDESAREYGRRVEEKERLDNWGRARGALPTKGSEDEYIDLRVQAARIERKVAWRQTHPATKFVLIFLGIVIGGGGFRDDRIRRIHVPHCVVAGIRGWQHSVIGPPRLGASTHDRRNR